MWREDFAGEVLEPVLESGAIVLLSAVWLVNLAAGDGVLCRRQELPPEAFVSLEKLKATCRDVSFLPIIALSYPWLSKSHPDPRGEHLKQIAQVLAALIAYRHGSINWGVFWDYGSLYQHGKEPRNAKQEQLFREGLAMLGSIYSHPWTWVFRLTKLPDNLPPGSNVRTYAERGWTFTESSWAQLSKSRYNSLDLGFLSGLTDWHEIREACVAGGGRRPPLTPAMFQQELEEKVFTNEKDDKPLVTRLYTEAFYDHMGTVTQLHYNNLDWGDAEVEVLCKVIETGVLQQVKMIDLRGNVVGEHNANRLVEAFESFQLPLCTEIRISSTNGLSVIEAPDKVQLLDTRLRQAKEARNFVQCKNIKSQMDKEKEKQRERRRLNEAMEKAVENDDFDESEVLEDKLKELDIQDSQSSTAALDGGWNLLKIKGAI